MTSPTQPQPPHSSTHDLLLPLPNPMEETVDDSDSAGFWLPSHFLTDDDDCFSTVDPPPRSGIPAFGSSSVVYAVHSPVSSTGTEPDQGQLLAGLTCQLARSSLVAAASTAKNLNRSPQTFTGDTAEMSTSPQSTLTSFGGWPNCSGRGTPDAGSFQLPPVEMDLHQKPPIAAQGHGILKWGCPQYHQVGHGRNNHPQQRQLLSCCGGGLPPSAWPPLRSAQQRREEDRHLLHPFGGTAVREASLCGVKRKSAGTGVFLPRRYGGCSSVYLPAGVVQALKLNLEEANGHHHPLLSRQSLVSDQDVVMMMARRRNAAAAAAAALWAQQRRKSVMRAEGGMNHETLLLPQEWTY